MKVALLGLGTVGSAVFQILKDESLPICHLVDIKYVLVRNIHNKKIDPSLLITDYNLILEDDAIEVVIEMMGADVSYDYMKKALLAGKHVITANKEVIAKHYIELQTIALEKQVNLLFEAAVGGGIPIVHALLTIAPYNHIHRIEGILNGTTNFILTSMHQEKIEFSEALKIAQEKGFAEADPTADLEGLDMVRKIAILSMICYQCPIDLDKVYHYGISHISKEIVDVIDLLDYKLKLVASSTLIGNKVSLCVEPVILKKTDLLANVSYENNLIRYSGDYCDEQMMYGKGAGKATANSILLDLELLMSQYQQTFLPTLQRSYLENHEIKAKYILKVKNKINKKIIEKRIGDMIFTKEISKEDLIQIQKDIDFYARLI